MNPVALKADPFDPLTWSNRMRYYKKFTTSKLSTLDELYTSWQQQTETWNNLTEEEQEQALKIAKEYYDSDEDTKAILKEKYLATPRKPTNNFMLPQFEVLNELKDDSSATDSNVASLTRFLFECDKKSYAWQLHNANSHDDVICRAVFSGSKSLHCIIELDEPCQSLEEYKDIWTFFNAYYFDNNADTACVNPARLTRTPHAKRVGTWVVQKLVFENDNKFSRARLYSDCSNRAGKFIRGNVNVDEIAAKYQEMRASNEAYRATRMKRLDSIKNPTPMQKFLNKKDCMNVSFVQQYLTTPYPNRTGNNGESRLGLFKSIKYCQEHFDDDTLHAVIAKAKSEKWSDKEINDILAYNR